MYDVDNKEQPQLYYKITFGSFNRKDSRLETPGSQSKDNFSVGHSRSIVIVAWMYHFKYKPYEWNAIDLDNIICKGDYLHYELDCAREEDNLSTDVSFETKIACTFPKQRVKQKVRYEPVHKLSFFGKFTGLRGKLKKYMAGCDQTSRCILFTCKQISFGIFGYIGLNGAVEYCLFDPHGRNSDGYYDYAGKSSISCYKSVDDVVNLLARDEIFAHCQYTCVPMKRMTFLSSDRLLWVELHNSQRFVDEYLTGEGAVESSETSSGDSETDDGNDEASNKLDVSTAGKTTLSGRTVTTPVRLTVDTHPSFFRGKLREDMKRSKGKWKQ